MIDVMHTAIAGLRVSVQRLAVAADNVANASSSGRLEPYDGYAPQRLDQGTHDGGAPHGIVRPIDNLAFPAYSPTDPLANTDGIVGMPKVSLPAQFVDLAVARWSYAANVAVLETTNEMMRIFTDPSVDREI